MEVKKMIKKAGLAVIISPAFCGDILQKIDANIAILNHK